MNWKKRIAVMLVAFVLGGPAILLSTHQMGLVETEKAYQEATIERLLNIGETQTLKVLPLINWHTLNDKFQGEQGVSYLIQTDEQTILFDVGHNEKQTSPSPLQHNMKQAGVKLTDIDSIFISHNHFDHVGGKSFMREATFSLGLEQTSLDKKKVYTPIPMTYPGITPTFTPNPTIIGKGVATSGTIPRQLIIGRIDEQFLAINVANKGMVLIVGCGHQTTPKIIERAQKLFNQPIYGVIGDLHYPVPEGRINIAGLNAQRTLASGDGIFSPLTQTTVNEELAQLKSLDLKIMALGGHDSSDQVIAQFQKLFAQRFSPVRVGEWILVSTTN